MHYLRGDPVEAESARPTARLGRFLERHPFATATVVTLFAAAIGLAMQNQNAWVPALQATADRFAARTVTMFTRWRSSEPTGRSH